MIMVITLILLIVFTLPLTQLTIENTLDVSDMLNVKSDLSKITQAVQQVYGEGQGSKHSINILSQHSIKIIIDNNYISTNVKLNDGSSKLIKMDCDSNLKKSSINLAEGENIVIVEWPVDSKNMLIYTKLF